MYKQRIVLFIFLFSICTAKNTFSQIAQGTFSVGGCVPFNTSYAAPAGASNHNWNFGDATGITTIANGTHNYATSGTYSCTYSGIVSGTPVSFTVVVHVNPKPVPLFSIAQPANNCVVKTVTLTNLSTGGSVINNWQWTYGDGGAATYTNGNPHTYGYTLPGTFSISLKVTDINGCNDLVTIGTVSAYPTPTAMIGSSPPSLSACFPPFSPSYSSLIPALSGATYAWSFGNSQTSTLINPGTVTYNNTGSYTVSLTITANGCSSTHTRAVVVNPPTLLASAPPTVCVGAPFTVTVQSNQPSTSWNLGGGIVAIVPSTPLSSQQTVTSVFSTPGLKTITVTAGIAPCTTSSLVTVYVDQVIANFASTPPHNSCSSPFLVNYQSTSSPNAVQFSWSYTTTQNTTVTATGSPHTFTFTQGSKNPYANFNSLYSPPFAPSVTLVASSVAGCSDSVVHVLDSITKPTASFYKSIQEGCVPLAVTFTSNSFVFPHNPITSYTWCNGATPSLIVTGTGSNVSTPTFTYNTAGTYTPYLIIQTAQGCVDVSFIDTVYAAVPPVISFSVSPLLVCPDQTVHITNTTAPNVMSQIDHWHVDSDNGVFSGCISDPNPGWLFNHVGVHGFTMSAYVNGCKGTALSVQNVTVNGPIVRSRYETNCTNRYSVDFYSHLQATPNFTLDFGDNTPPRIVIGNTSTSDIFNHVYNASGDYPAKIIGANPGTSCPLSTYTMLVTVRNAQASVTGPQIACVGVGTTFTAGGSSDVFTGCSRGYWWYVDNLPPVDKTATSHTTSFSSAGQHTVMLVVKDINSCLDTAVAVVRVSSVTPAFAFSSPSICVNSTVQLINTSTSVPLDPIVFYYWTFEPGQNLQTSTPTSPVHSYSNASFPATSFAAALTVSNSVGCVASTFRSILVVKPNAFFTPSSFNFCIGPSPNTITFTAQGNNASYTLNFAPNPVTTLTTTSNISTFSYSAAGTYSVSLKTRDFNGCEASSSTVQLVAEKTPTTNFTFFSPKSNGGNVICSPANVTFSANGGVNSSPIVNYNWNLGSGTAVLSQPTVAFQYSNPSNTTIVVSLTLTTNLGCSAVQTKTFSLFTPKADIVASKTTVCIGEAITFSIKDTTSRGIYAWNWDFGNNNNTDTVLAGSSPPSTTVQPFSVFNPPNGEILISLNYHSSQLGCSDVAKMTIRVIKVDADFKRNDESARQDSIHCLNVQDNFFNTSPGASTNPPLWKFGNGAISTLQNPDYIYPLPGVYQVSLTVSGEQGCIGQTAKNMTINPLPLANITAKDSVCRDALFTLTGAGTSTAGIVAYVWSPTGSVNNASVSPTTASASQSGSYSLVVIDGNGCVSPPAFTYVYVQQPPPSFQWDSTVVVGQPIPMNSNLGPQFSYSWSPVADLSCLSCIYPVSSSTVNITYSVEVQDNMACFRVTNTYTIYIDPQTSVDVPTAFTPNGDGINDVIYVDGWGIKKLNYFRIFNRWGQLLFESNDIKTGWDGFYNGVPQNMETYVYQVSVMTYLDQKDLIKTSSFRLIR
jgi:gliding motility-associated-like protein